MPQYDMHKTPAKKMFFSLAIHWSHVPESVYNYTKADNVLCLYFIHQMPARMGKCLSSVELLVPSRVTTTRLPPSPARCSVCRTASVLRASYRVETAACSLQIAQVAQIIIYTMLHSMTLLMLWTIDLNLSLCPVTDPCAVVDCQQYHYCEVSSVTGNAVCVPSCELENGGCRSDQICTIEEYDCFSTNGDPCDPNQYIQCKNSPYGEC